MLKFYKKNVGKVAMKKKHFSDKWIDYNILKEYCKKCPDSINVDNLKITMV